MMKIKSLEISFFRDGKRFAEPIDLHECIMCSRSKILCRVKCSFLFTFPVCYCFRASPNCSCVDSFVSFVNSRLGGYDFTWEHGIIVIDFISTYTGYPYSSAEAIL